MNEEARVSGPRAALVLAVAVALVGWLLVHPYMGLFHDGNLYALQALAHLHPESLPHDVFLRFGSQDHFTLFSPLYARGIALLGIDRAAMWITLLSQLGLLAAAAFLSTRLLPRGAAMFGAAAVAVVPLYYGPDRIFSVLEGFCTPRTGAEALVILGLACATKMRILCALFLLCALLLHPVMALPGIIAAVWLQPSETRARLLAPVPLLTLAAAGAAVLAALHGWQRFDQAWLSLVQARSPYLFLSFWTLDDWGRAAVVLATLLLASVHLQGGARRFARVTAAVVVLGWALTFIGCDLLHLVLVTQLQPWRWQWLADVGAVLLLPQLASALWTEGRAGIASALLMLAGWLLAADSPALIASTAAVTSLSVRRLAPPYQRLVLWGAWLIAALALIWRVAFNLQFSDSHYIDASLPFWLRDSMSFAADGSLALLLLTAIRLLPARFTRFALAPLIAAAACVVLLVTPNTWRAWTVREFPKSQVESFAHWRALIPEHSEVLWSESALSVWVLLNRANYLSGLQTSGLVYSRPAALEMQRRAESLGGISSAAFLKWDSVAANLRLTSEQLRAVCDAGNADYLVTFQDIGRTPAAVAAGGGRHPLKLYRCYARAAAAAT